MNTPNTCTLAQLAQELVETLESSDIDPESIDPDAPLFHFTTSSSEAGNHAVQGLGLDSVDAAVLAAGLEKKYGVRIETVADAATAFASLRSLHVFIKAALARHA